MLRLLLKYPLLLCCIDLTNGTQQTNKATYIKIVQNRFIQDSLDRLCTGCQWCYIVHDFLRLTTTCFLKEHFQMHQNIVFQHVNTTNFQMPLTITLVSSRQGRSNKTNIEIG